MLTICWSCNAFMLGTVIGAESILFLASHVIAIGVHLGRAPSLGLVIQVNRTTIIRASLELEGEDAVPTPSSRSSCRHTFFLINFWNT